MEQMLSYVELNPELAKLITCELDQQPVTPALYNELHAYATRFVNTPIEQVAEAQVEMVGGIFSIWDNHLNSDVWDLKEANNLNIIRAFTGIYNTELQLCFVRVPVVALSDIYLDIMSIRFIDPRSKKLNLEVNHLRAYSKTDPEMVNTLAAIGQKYGSDLDGFLGEIKSKHQVRYS